MPVAYFGMERVGLPHGRPLRATTSARAIVPTAAVRMAGPAVAAAWRGAPGPALRVGDSRAHTHHPGV
ncbi:hypothetical protein, partial [Streptomyces galilaeus]|uniref:hypothetical protein n=1 Tax=Streptomyces galilaeus TaxID=33899 RepID=UPI0038F71E29